MKKHANNSDKKKSKNGAISMKSSSKESFSSFKSFKGTQKLSLKIPKISNTSFNQKKDYKISNRLGKIETDMTTMKKGMIRLNKNMKLQGKELNSIKNELSTTNKLLIKLINTVKKNNNNESHGKKNIEINAQPKKKANNNPNNKINIFLKDIPENNRYRQLFNTNVQESSSYKCDSLINDIFGNDEKKKKSKDEPKKIDFAFNKNCIKKIDFVNNNKKTKQIHSKYWIAIILSLKMKKKGFILKKK